MEKDWLSKIKEAGIVGAGGAGFPTSFKLNAKPEYIIVNGIECEPLIQVDQQLAAKEAPFLLKTLDFLVKEMNCRQGIIALKDKYTAAVSAVQKEIPNYPNLQIKTFPSVYPMGDEHVLVYETIGKIVPEGGIPLNVGAVVINTETLYNIGEALKGNPVSQKFITVTGEVQNPKTFKVALGVSFKELIDAAGGVKVANPVLINGGPLMGSVLRDLNAPVIKTSKAIIVLDASHPLIIAKERSINSMLKIAKTACCHCMHCSELCPRHLLGHNLYPDKLMRLAAYNSTCDKDASATTAYLCSECRLCEYSCIMQLQPWKLNKALKARLKEAGIKNPHNNTPKSTHPFRQYRLYPTDKLVRQLGLWNFYHASAPLEDYCQDIKRVVAPMSQHFGAPAIPAVSAGDNVKAGDKIAAMADGALGADICASIDGTVQSADKNAVIISHA